MMEHASNELAVEFLTGNNSLLDSKLTSLRIDEGDCNLQLELVFSGRDSAIYESIRLIFSKILEFEFSHTRDYVFGNVENVKFFVTKDGAYYLSIDPDGHTPSISDNDKDFVMARSVSAYAILKENRGLGS